jgi:hypothetical protein
MFGKYNGFVSRTRVSACMYFLVDLLKSKSKRFSHIGSCKIAKVCCKQDAILLKY